MAKILTAYFSMTGQTWAGGDIVELDKGFTNIAAEYVQEAVGGDLFHIQQVRTYSPDHFTMIDEAKQEFQSNARPALKGFCDGFADYDTVFLGFPNWWGTVPMPVLTFVEHYDWAGKRLVPFVTSGGSGFGHALRDLAKAAPGAVIDDEGLAVLGTQVEASKDQIQAWARGRVQAKA